METDVIITLGIFFFCGALLTFWIKKLVEDLGYNELFDRYVKPTGRNLDILQIERVVYAEKVGDA